MNMKHTTTFEKGIPEMKTAGENRRRNECVPACRLAHEKAPPGGRGTAGDEGARTGRTGATTSGAAYRQTGPAQGVCTAAGTPVLFLWGEHAELILS